MADIQFNRTVEVDVDKIHNYERHAFKIEENEDMAKLEESIRKNGVLVPVILRPKGEAEFECVSGHRRIYVCKKIGITKVPAMIKELSDDDADILMVDSNLTMRTKRPDNKKMEKIIKRTHDGLADAFTWHRNYKNASATDRAELMQKLLNEYFEKMYG